MNENETERNLKTIRINEQTYNRLSELGTLKQTFNDVIERLINFYEAYNTGMHSSSIQVLKESVDFPVNEEKKQIALQLFEEILSLGDNVSFTLQVDTEWTPLIETRKNFVTFYKSNTPLCLARTRETSIELYLPTNQEKTPLPGWKHRMRIFDKSQIEAEIEVIKRLYEDL